MKAEFKKYILNFISPGGTSRGVLSQKNSWILRIGEDNVYGYGEVSLIQGLSPDDADKIPDLLKEVCIQLEKGKKSFSSIRDNFPAVHFALEQVLRDFDTGGTGVLFKNDFTDGKKGIKMNGLVWMNPVDVMKMEAEKKIGSGFTCLKFKIGTYNFNDELQLLKYFRKKYQDQIEIRVDANGAYNEENVFHILDELAKLKVHSIEQPVKPGQFRLMSKVCNESPVPVALDEELIGVPGKEIKNLLDELNPGYLILKPSLLGGWKATDEWIKKAEDKNIGWWVTSALESNIGLNAIAQWVANYDLKIPQGLGTGGLYTNNFMYPLEVRGDKLWLDKKVNRKITF